MLCLCYGKKGRERGRGDEVSKWLTVRIDMSARDLSRTSTAALRTSWTQSLLSLERQKNHYKLMNG